MEILTEGKRVGGCCLKVRDYLVNWSIRPQVRLSRNRFTEEVGQKLGTSVRQVEDRLVHQMLDDCLPTDVDDEGNSGPDLRDVGKVLLRSHSYGGSACASHALHLVQDVQVRSLVRDEVVGSERAVLLRELLDDPRELGG